MQLLQNLLKTALRLLADAALALLDVVSYDVVVLLQGIKRNAIMVVEGAGARRRFFFAQELTKPLGNVRLHRPKPGVRLLKIRITLHPRLLLEGPVNRDAELFSNGELGEHTQISRLPCARALISALRDSKDDFLVFVAVLVVQLLEILIVFIRFVAFVLVVDVEGLELVENWRSIFRYRPLLWSEVASARPHGASRSTG
mmetsp:Transcript_4755/g.19027  ORF Transcript_4755/g.19027 Transcript_4755/m.19027 type:complete len:200 (+) Transcript_4755:314-913(+)